VAQHRGRLNAGRNSTQDFSDKFDPFLDSVGNFITAYRDKAKWVNGSYKLGYEHHTALVGQLRAEVAREDAVAEILVGAALHILTGGVGEMLVHMKVISDLAETVGGAIVTAGADVGIKTLAKVPEPEATETSAPVFKELMAFQKLDELNQAAFPLARDGGRLIAKALFETSKLQDALMAPEGDPGHIEKAWFMQRMDALGNLFDQIPQATAAATAGNAKFDEVFWSNFFGSPWPTDRDCEQDIWVVWMAEQQTKDDPDTKGGVEMRDPEGLLPQLADELVPNPLLRKRAFKEHMDAIGGKAAAVAGYHYDVWIKENAEAMKPVITTYWASVFMEE
jgi:hypothetical protein